MHSQRSKNFGLAYGLRRLSDLVGADIGLHVGKNFMNEWPERNYKAFIFPLLNDAGMLGEKTGKGFYAFDKKCAQLLRLWSATCPLC